MSYQSQFEAIYSLPPFGETTNQTISPLDLSPSNVEAVFTNHRFQGSRESGKFHELGLATIKYFTKLSKKIATIKAQNEDVIEDVSIPTPLLEDIVSHIVRIEFLSLQKAKQISGVWF